MYNPLPPENKPPGVIFGIIGKNISNKNRLWADNLKKLQLVEQKKVFSKRKYSSLYKPPEYKPPPPRKIWRKGPLTKNEPRSLLSEFYGIYRVCRDGRTTCGQMEIEIEQNNVPYRLPP